MRRPCAAGCILFVLLCVRGHEHGDDGHAAPICDRVRAREARAAIRSRLLAVAGQFRAVFSTQCPLHPDHDHLLHHEAQKEQLTQYQWRCGLCKKIFRSEHYLDLHLERKHRDVMPQNTSDCLGDYCDILGCPSWVADVQRDQHLHRHRTHGAGQCADAKKLDARRHFCQHLMHDCFATGPAEDAHAAFEALDEVFCEPISCEQRQRVRDGLEAFGALTETRESRGAYAVLVSLVVLVLVVVYIWLYCWVTETRVGQSGLRPRPGRRGWFGAAANPFGRKSKAS